MHRIYRFVLFFVFTGIFSIISNAQDKDIRVLLMGNVQYHSPVSDFKKGYKNGFGLEAGLGIGIKNTFLLGSAGYHFYKPQDPAYVYGDIVNLAVNAGLRQYLLPRRLFIGLNGGYGFLKDEVNSGLDGRFIADVNAGVTIGLIELGASYGGWKKKNTDGWSNTFSIKLGFQGIF